MGAGKLGGWWGGPRGEQNCGRLPSVTDPPPTATQIPATKQVIKRPM